MEIVKIMNKRKLKAYENLLCRQVTKLRYARHPKKPNNFVSSTLANLELQAKAVIWLYH
mgnify:CR=1 FL=1